MKKTHAVEKLVRLDNLFIILFRGEKSDYSRRLANSKAPTGTASSRSTESAISGPG